MKLSLLTFLLLAILPLVLASEPEKGSWRSRFWPFNRSGRSQAVEEPRPPSPPYSEETRPVVAEFSQVPVPAVQETVLAENRVVVEDDPPREKSTKSNARKPKMPEHDDPSSHLKGSSSPAPTSYDEIAEKDAPTGAFGKIKSLYAYATNACAVGANCVKGLFHKKNTETNEEEEDTADHTRDPVDSQPIGPTPAASATSDEIDEKDAPAGAFGILKGLYDHATNACAVGANCVKGFFRKKDKESNDTADDRINPDLVHGQSTSSDAIAEKEAPTGAFGRLKGIYAKAKNACTVGANCVKGFFRKKDKEEENTADHTSDHHDSKPTAHAYPILDIRPPGPAHSTGGKKTWVERIMRLSVHERFMLFKSGSSFETASSENSRGIFQRVGQFCKCVLNQIADGTKKLGNKLIPARFRRPKEVEPESEKKPI